MPRKAARPAIDDAIARIAAPQYGVVSTAQLLDAGVLSSGITDRVRLGRLHRIHRGVYAVGHTALSNEARWMGAVLAIGDDAALSHRSAAALWKILPRLGPDSSAEPVDVIVPGHSGRASRRGINVHRSSTLQPGDCTRRQRIPVTTPARTLADLHRLLPVRQFASALREAEFLRLPIGRNCTPDHTRSELESKFLALCRHHRLPQPAVNVRVGRFVVDFLWRGERLIVEMDGWEAHRTRSAFEEDRARDARLKLLGYEVLRFTWRQMASERMWVARTIRALLRS